MRMRVRSSEGNEAAVLLKCTYEYLWPSYYKDERSAVAGKGYSGWTNETCLDETHMRRNGHYVSGGSLDVLRWAVKSEPVPMNYFMENSVRRWQLSGVIYPTFWKAYLPDITSENLPPDGGSQTLAYGPQAWDKFKPGKPQAGISVFLAELRDLPGMLRARAYAHRNLGKHYLNAQFGWLPFVSDLRKMYQSYVNIDRTLRNIQNMNGKWVKRSGSVKSDTSIVSRWSDKGHIPVFTPLVWDDVDDRTQLECEGQLRSSERVWFSGRFRYYIPDIDSKLKDSRWRRSTVRKIMGLTITPADVWEAVPWSWLIDYFTNAGNILSNLSSGYVDDVVASYAYIMRSSIMEAHQKSSGMLWPGQKYCGTITSVTESKCRRAADPFGFSMSGDLAPRQLAILAALGLSRA